MMSLKNEPVGVYYFHPHPALNFEKKDIVYIFYFHDFNFLSVVPFLIGKGNQVLVLFFILINWKCVMILSRF